MVVGGDDMNSEGGIDALVACGEAIIESPPSLKGGGAPSRLRC